jgi:hypothetical protein
MLLKTHKRGLPTTWHTMPGGKAVAYEWDCRLHPNARLALKLLVFEDVPGMVKFWNRTVGHQIDHQTRGCVNRLIETVEDVPAKGKKPKHPPYLRADPRYFAVMGLVVGHCSAEIVGHECVHAAFAHFDRVRRNTFGRHARDETGEEPVCYAAGRLFVSVTKCLTSKGLFYVA